MNSKEALKELKNNFGLGVIGKSLCDIISQDIEKYKMAIEILKDFFNVGEIDGDYLINANGFNKLSKLDYELLKEVIEDETNN